MHPKPHKISIDLELVFGSNKSSSSDLQKHITRTHKESLNQKKYRHIQATNNPNACWSIRIFVTRTHPKLGK